MADVQIENGYTRLANDILESMAQIKLSPTQYRILFLLWRYTYGFKRKEHEMSLSFFSQATGVDKRNIQRELKGLEERKIIHQTIKSGSFRKISFNKNHDEWIGKTAIGETTIGEITNGETNNTGVGETNNSAIGEINNTTIGETNNQERNKENFKENSKENSSSNDVSEIISFWDKNGFGINNINAKNDLLSYLDDGYSKDMVLEALKIACNKNARHINFVKGVFRNWIDKGIRAIEQIKELEDKKQSKKRSIFDQGEESKKRQAEIKPLTAEEQEQLRKWEEELPY